MTESDPGARRMTNAAGLIGLATAVIGLVATGITVLGGAKSDKPQPPAASPAAAAEEKLDGVPDMIGGYMSGPAYVEYIARNQLCYGLDADGACQATVDLIQRGPRTFRIRLTLATRIPERAYDPLDLAVADDFETRRLPRPEGLMKVDEVDYTVTREGICITPEVRTAGAARSLAFGILPDGSITPVSSRGLAEFRDKLRESFANESIASRQCWRYRVENNQLRQDYFIDGVLQPADVVMFDHLPAGSHPSLHLPT